MMLLKLMTFLWSFYSNETAGRKDGFTSRQASRDFTNYGPRSYSEFNREGRAGKERSKPTGMVASTLCNAVSNVAASFRADRRPSPFRFEGREGDGKLLPSVKELLKAFEARDPPPNRQKAIARHRPQIIPLRDLKQLAACWGELAEHSADLIEGAYFFAMRSREFCKAKRKGKNKTLRLRNILFRDRRGAGR
jgi:hypothetical protein